MGRTSELLRLEELIALARRDLIWLGVTCEKKNFAQIGLQGNASILFNSMVEHSGWADAIFMK